jgi:RlmL ferredoxin-like domain
VFILGSMWGVLSNQHSYRDPRKSRENNTPLEEELSELGAEEVRPEFRGVHFKADKSTLYRINLVHCTEIMLALKGRTSESCPPLMSLSL